MLRTAVDRQAQIAERVRQNGFQTVRDLAALFGVTTQTIRRDISELSESGVLKRRHGGVELPVPLSNIGFDERQTLNFEAKNKIAREVARWIPDGASVAMSIGTTPAMVVRHLSQHRALKIFTNNIAAAMTACSMQSVEVHIPGGCIRSDGRDVVGGEAEAFFERFMVDIGIYGVGGIEGGSDLLDFHEEEVRVRESIRRNSRRSFLVVDATKFDRAAHVRGGLLSDADVVFCDRLPPADAKATLEARQRQLVVCDGEARA